MGADPRADPPVAPYPPGSVPEKCYKGPVTYYGEGGYNTGGGHVKFYPYEKGGGSGKSFSHVKGGGGTTSFGVVFTL